jgi:DNA-binding transcriptional MocR family regulator
MLLGKEPVSLREGTTLRRSSKISLPGLRLKRGSQRTLQQQLHEHLRRAILEGKLPVGSVMPPTRALAKTLRISRNTVLGAYDLLSAEGLLTSLAGSCTRVSASKATVVTLPQRKAFDLWAALRAARYPATASDFSDPDGNPLYAHR